MFGKITYKDIIRYQEQKYCIGCIFDTGNTKDIYSVLVNNKKTSFIYNTCVDCEMYFNNNIATIPGEVIVYKDYEQIYKGHTADLRYVYKAIIADKINKIIPIHEKRMLYRQYLDYCKYDLGDDIIFIIQSFL